ncbi:hypothetical protein BGW80DRAFT_1445075 [Lactifluus volemus]|nr:hypothetical protein BGW80DRAFT_1445075 [Lactifluus volemus]
MAPFQVTFAFLAILAASLASAVPIALDNTTLLSNAQQAEILNCEFQSLQTSDPCNTGETACIQNAFATCVNNAWQTQSCSQSKMCFALPQVRANGTFVACTSQNNAASIIAASGGIGSTNCSSLGNSVVPFPTVSNDSLSGSTQGGSGGNNPDCGNNGSPSSPGSAVSTVTITVIEPEASTALILPPTTTTLTPDQASSLLSLLSANSMSLSTPSASVLSTENADNVGGTTPTVIQLTPLPLSSPTPTLAPTPSVVASPPSGAYPY